MDRRKIVRDSLTVALAVSTYGVSFGAVARTNGLSVLQTCALSLLMFSGASQFAFVGVVGAGGSAVSAVLSATGLGIRNGFYGLRLASLLDVRGWRRAATAQLVIDESTAMALGHERDGPGAGRLAFAVTGAGIYLFWNLATLVGALAVGAVGDPRTVGLDAAVPAAFLALVAPRLVGSAERRVAAVAVVIALLAVGLSPAGVPVLLAAFAVLAANKPSGRRGGSGGGSIARRAS